MEEPRLYNSRIIDTYLKLVRAKYPHVDIGEILRHAGMEAYEVADQATWFTQEQINRFYERVVQATGNSNIAREAGRYAAAPGTLGVMRQYTLGLLGPGKTFSLIDRVTRNFTRSSDYRSRQLADNTVELTVTPRAGVREEEFQCKNRLGFFEAIVTIFNLSAPVIEHPECLFEGGEVCRYHIHWTESPTFLYKKLRNLFGIGALAAGGAGLMLVEPLLWATTVLPLGLAVYLALHCLVGYSQRKELMAALDHLWDSSEQLALQIDLNYRNTQLAREVGEVISTKTRTGEVIDSVIQVLEKTLDFDRGVILLADEESQRLEIRGAYGYSEQHLGVLTTTSFRLNNPEGRGPFVVSFREQKPILVNDITEIEKDLTPKSLAFVKALDTHSFISCPIVLEGKSIGVLGVDNIQTKKSLLNSDVNLLMGISPVIAMSIHNARLLESRAAQFDSTLRVLAESIDARDFLTAGHSQKVAEYAEEIARELKMPDDYRQMVRTAALLHDYGKIGIPDAILKKDGGLTSEERAVIQTHPYKTKQILEKVAFEGLYKQIPEIVLAHHEHWDGSGYPNALKGREIPVGARIIAVADFFEAITSKRHYREPMPIQEALGLLQAESGSHFEPRIIEAFLSYLAKNQGCRLDPPDKPLTSLQTRQPRFAYRTGVSTKVDQRTIAGSSVDISQNGLFINTEDVTVSPDADITITFALPWEEKLVQVVGRVVWVNAGDPRPAERLPTGFGVQFRDVGDAVRRALISYVGSGMQGTGQPFQFQ